MCWVTDDVKGDSHDPAVLRQRYDLPGCAPTPGGIPLSRRLQDQLPTFPASRFFIGLPPGPLRRYHLPIGRINGPHNGFVGNYRPECECGFGLLYLGQSARYWAEGDSNRPPRPSEIWPRILSERNPKKREE